MNAGLQDEREIASIGFNAVAFRTLALTMAALTRDPMSLMRAMKSAADADITDWLKVYRKAPSSDGRTADEIERWMRLSNEQTFGNAADRDRKN